jgi:PAS domain S-box-containing protein
MPPTKPLLHDYRVALATPMLAFVFALLLPTSGQLLHLPLFMVAVLVSASYGGLYSGALATTLSTLFLAFHYVLLLWLRPGNTDRNFLLWLGAFVALGLLTSYLSRLCRRSIEEAVRLQTALATLRTALILTDTEGRITFANPLARTLTGWQGSDAAAEPVENVFCTDAERPVGRVLQSADGSGLVQATRLLARSGAERQIEFWADPLQDPRGATCGASLLFREAGERWRAEQELRLREERYRALTACVPGAVLLLDSAGQCVYCNAACQTLVGCSAAEALGNGWMRSVHADDQSVAAEWVEAARHGKPFAAELRFVDPQGGSRWVQLRSTAVLSDQGKGLGHVGAFEEVTRRKELEQEVQERQRAEEALRKTHDERDAEARQRIAELEQANAVLRDQLAERGRVENDLRQEQERSRQQAQRQEQELRQRLADADKAGALLREQLGERSRAEDELRRQQDEARQREEDLRRRLGESEKTATELRAQLEEDGAEEELQRLQEEAQQREEELRQRLAESEKACTGLRERWSELEQTVGPLREQLAERQRVEEELRCRLAEVESAGNAVQQELDERRRREEELCRQKEEALAQATQREDELREQHRVSRSQSEEERTASEAALAQLREQQRFLRTLTGSLGDGVYATRSDGTITFVNAAAERLLGWTEAEMLGRNIEEWMQPPATDEQTSAANGYYTEPQAAPEAVHNRRSTFRRKDGSAVTLACTVAPLLDDQPTHGSVVCFREAGAPAGEPAAPHEPQPAHFFSGLDQNVFLDRLTRVLRRPLGSLAQALWTFQAERNRHAVEIVQREMGSLTLLTGSLETMADLARGRLRLDPQPVELEALLKRTVEAVQPFLEERGQRLTLSLPLTPEWLLADPVRLEQILVHLLHNAVMYTETGGHIRLSAERRGNEMMFRIQDEGGGIRAEDLPGLFDLEHPAEGLGLGLPVVRRLTEMHGGRVSAASGGPGKGSEFTVALPAPRKTLTRTAAE